MKEIDDIKNVIKVLDESHEKISNYAKTKKAYKKVGWGSFFHKGWIIDTLMFLAFVGGAIGFADANATLVNDKPYHQRYVFYVRINEAGLITEYREYMNPIALREAIAQLSQN